MLLRQYIEHALYARHGYFAAKQVVGRLQSAQPLPYATLRDEEVEKVKLTQGNIGWQNVTVDRLARACVRFATCRR